MRKEGVVPMGVMLLCDLTGVRVVVVGLGKVGMRKARELAKAGAMVVGVDPNPEIVWDDEDRSSVGAGVDVDAAAERVVWVREGYRAEHLSGARMAVAAVGGEVNRRVAGDARRLGIWVADLGGEKLGDVSFPAVWSDGELRVAVATGGASPGLAGRVCREIGDSLSLGGTAGLVRVLGLMRERVRTAFPDRPEVRWELMREWSHPRWAEEIRLHGEAALLQRFLEALDARMSAVPPNPENLPEE